MPHYCIRSMISVEYAKIISLCVTIKYHWNKTIIGRNISYLQRNMGVCITLLILGSMATSCAIIMIWLQFDYNCALFITICYCLFSLLSRVQFSQAADYCDQCYLGRHFKMTNSQFDSLPLAAVIFWSRCGAIITQRSKRFCGTNQAAQA